MPSMPPAPPATNRGSSMDITELAKAAHGFAERLDRVKRLHQPEVPPHIDRRLLFSDRWYPHQSIGNVYHLERLLTGENRSLFEKLKHHPLADIGAADGEVGFFFESRGFDVDIIDNPSTNWNHLCGAHTLKRLLGAAATIHEIDLDEQFRLPRARYGAVFFLGILYHLQNPYYCLRKLALSAEYCFLSSRIARFAGALDIGGAAVAYLLAPGECNNDPSNYWIFSQAGLQRLLSRTGWDILDWHTYGDTRHSDVSSADRDQRAFALLRSKLAR
jgi:tRNA (mo5U34)-methyltransferase